MWLDVGWTQRGLDALRDTLDVDAATKRDMIQFLFDEGFWDGERLTWPAAVARFNACNNPSKSEFWKLSELWALARRFERHALLHAMAEDMGFELRRVPTQERLQGLLERLVQTQTEVAAAIEASSAELARLQGGEQSLRIDPRLHDAGPKFALPTGPAAAGSLHHPGGF
ncbi:MAG: hypothetical protein L0H70_04140 [Xanthomonadales bacterium]|nr:hypothetical protein [Xanthomonadales bacterium]